MQGPTEQARIAQMLPKEVLKAFEKAGRDEDTPCEEKTVIAKFFNPTGAGTWLATEYDPESKIFFGFVEIFDGEGEWGYFALEELSGYVGRFGLGIERDVHFEPKKFKETHIGRKYL